MKLLIAEDEKLLRMNLRDSLLEAGYEVVEAASGIEAWRLVEAERPAIVLADVRMAGMDGLELLQRTRTAYPATEVVIMTTYASVKDAVTALKAGAADYVVKPFEMDEFLERVAHVAELTRLRQRADDLERQVVRLRQTSIFLGVSRAMQETWRLLQRVAGQDVDVLIEGETGTGKEIVARAIHEGSMRASGPFIPVSFAGLSANLVEDELFGHERGAFTGADRPRPGRVEAAQDGTLFLDDVDDIPPEMQGKLLRVLQERNIERLGSNATHAVDFRLLAASKQNLAHMVENQTFRRDLYHRLHVVHITLPPLRERREDILPMASFFLKQFSQGRPSLPSLHPAAAACLQHYDWLGNVRELKHVIQGALALCDGDTVLPAHLPDEICGTVRGHVDLDSLSHCGAMQLDEVLRETERRLLLQAMERAGGNQSQAAALLGVARSTFQYRWAKLIGEDQSSGG